MIRLTYTHICDLCRKEIMQEDYDCTNYLGGAFPRPRNTHTYQIGYTAEMCPECAAQIIEARDKVVAEWKEKTR